MTRRLESSPRTIAELVGQLGRITHGDGYTEGLTPAQWSALRYLSRANRFSRTVSAFAEFHATTRGTASQTVKGLVARGYLNRTRAPRDGRSTRLEVTDNARAILARDPCEALVRAASALPPSVRDRLATGLERLLGHLVQGRRKRPFGVCTSCAHLEVAGWRREGEPRFKCAFFGELLEETELAQICINFQPGKDSAMKRAFRGQA
ncbi:MAG: MarR family transcriptional regulator [Gemmatimonadetes bacterium]|nr:MarR family transcriptional regulator [Gemmatimonadota bacterium]